MTIDYKSTVLLPRTDFPMKGNLPQREPDMLAKWRDGDLYGRMRREADGRPPFILHDGPPYANGHLHIGHALNKILKDVINRSQQMTGRDSRYVPGWDCHGLPIEWKIEEQYRADGRDKDEVPIVEFRKECREFADKWIDVQRDEFRRLGVEGDWDNPYTTMTYAAEAQIVRELGKFLTNGSLFRGARPVLWSPVEKTALAEAEVEYHDHTSTTIYVRFPVLPESAAEAVAGATIVIWTTTPWTMPGNRAIAVSTADKYVRLRVTAAGEGSLATPGEDLVVAESLLAWVLTETGITGHEVTATFAGDAVAGAICAHPLRGQGYDFDVPVLAADFVTMDQGTGFVHIAPGHGADDFELGRRHGLPVPQTVGEDGTFYAEVPLFAGKHVYRCNGEIADTIEAAGGLLGRGTLVHSYPHSWRSKAPLIFRNTPQWFISMETNGLRETALQAIEDTRFVPESGRTRLYSMIKERPDWCVSRQRAWGVPIPIFVEKSTGEPVRDQAVIDRVAEAVEAGGADAWFDSDPGRFLGPDRDPADFEQVQDIVDVWFDSGSTHSFVLEARNDQVWPASLYLEGSDQHRGWFHSSLLESCGTRGRAPYEAVLTHGFVMAEDGRKMSKSLGNVVSPQEVVDQHGAEILRLWVVASDYSEDLKIGPEIIKRQVDAYRRLRNTIRFVLGNLADFHDSERVQIADMPELERWVLHRLHGLDGVVRKAVDDFDFHTMFTALYNFCAVDLSAFYFDIRKDALYCDAVAATRRRAARTVLDELFNCLTAWLAPILCFTAEEAWLTRQADPDDSVHLRQFPDVPDAWRDDALAEKWRKLRAVRRVVTGAIELERAEKRIGSSLQAHPMIYVDESYAGSYDGIDLAELMITSDATLSDENPPAVAFTLEDVVGVAAVIRLADGEKCERCWRVLPEVGTDPAWPGACVRCGDAVAAIEDAA